MRSEDGGFENPPYALIAWAKTVGSAHPTELDVTRDAGMHDSLRSLCMAPDEVRWP